MFFFPFTSDASDDPFERMCSILDDEESGLKTTEGEPFSSNSTAGPTPSSSFTTGFSSNSLVESAAFVFVKATGSVSFKSIVEVTGDSVMGT